VTTGASGDFDMATNIAMRMVTEWGMSDKLGPRRYTDKQQSFAGQFGNISDDRKKLIDEEVDAILKRAYERSYKTQTDNHDKMHLLAQALLKYDVLTGEELRAVIDGKDIDEMRAVAEASRKTAPPSPPNPGNDNDGETPLVIEPPKKTGSDPWGPK
jgi:cell division protease FtsH